jgi:hypothetical protein
MISMDDFRTLEGYADLRTAVGEFLRSDAGMFAMRILRDRGRPTDVPPNMPELTSARELSKYHGYHLALDDFELLAKPKILGPEIESTFEDNKTDEAV